MFLVEQSTKPCLVDMNTKWAILYCMFRLPTLCHTVVALVSLFLHIYANTSSVPGSKTKELKACGRCPRIVRGVAALRRHCSEVHKQDIHGNPISVGLFPCPIPTCSKSRDPFKRQDKLFNHMRTAHTERTEGQEVNGGTLSGERDAALTTNNTRYTATAGNDFGVSHGDTSSSFPNQAPIHESLIMDVDIDPAFMEDFLFGGKVWDPLPLSALPEPLRDFSQHIATGGLPVAVENTVAVPYDTIDEAKQALLDARNKTLEKLRFINQQIENLEGRKHNRNEAVRGLDNMNDSFLQESFYGCASYFPTALLLKHAESALLVLDCLVLKLT